MTLDASRNRVAKSACRVLLLALGASACLEDPRPDPTGPPTAPGVVAAPLGEPGTPYPLSAPQTIGFAAGEGETDFVRLTVPVVHDGLRIAVRADANVDVFVRRTTHDGSIVGGAFGYDKPLHTFFFEPEDTVADDQWWIEIHADLAAHVDVQAEPVYARPLAWDGGSTLAGSALATRPDGGFGDHLYRITAQPALYGAWRSILKVTAGEADLSMGQDSVPNDFAYRGSEADGSDAVVLAQPEFQENQVWLLRVRARSGDADWSLLSGDIHVVDYGPLGDAPNVRTLALDVGGVGYFRTEATAQTLAWRLSTPGARFYVNDTAMPVVRYGSSTWDIAYTGEGLIVPDYLKAQGYLVAVTADTPTVQVDSRNHLVIDPLDVGASDPFMFAIDGDDDGFSYVTFEVEVPIDQIAWQVALTPVSGGEVDLYIGRSRVPSELDNDGMSEALAVTDAVSMVPQTLTDGTFYVTVKGQAPFTFTLTSGGPEVTPIDFTSTDVPNGAAHEERVGWRYFSVPKDGSALGTLGWIVELAGHVPGTVIALRKNFVPGRWSYRDFNGYGGTISHVDLESGLGFLEHPNHPDEFWYIGVYNPVTPLGAFLLSTRAIEATDLDFDDGVIEVTNQGSGRWRYFRVAVPPDMLGWDLRLDGVSSGRPRMVVRAELVPGEHQNLPYSSPPFWVYGDWDSGAQWALGPDLTRRPNRWIDQPNYLSEDETGRFFLSGHGNPLRQGTFYVGVSNTWTTLDGQELSYTIRSRGIGDGPNWNIPVQALAFDDGIQTATGLAPRELRVYRVDVPQGAESWYLELTPEGGDAMMAIRKDMVPSIEAGWSGATSDSTYQVTGARRQKNGVELFYRYPDYDKTALEAGTYYVVVAAEGAVAGQDSYIGTGTTGFTLRSHGVAPVTPGTLTTDAPLVYTDQHLRYGEQRAYRVSVPAGLSSIELRLTASAGKPWMNVSGVAAQPSPTQHYPAAEGGVYTSHSADDVITIQGPTSDTYTVLVTAQAGQYGEPLEADFDLEIEARGEETLRFNGGSIAVSDQATQTWRYFRVEVPAHALGWDLRLENVVGKPKLVIRRGQLPTDFYEQPQSPTVPFREAWPDGGTWAPTGELTKRNNAYYDDETYQGGEDESGRSVVMGLGSPLTPGTYYVGVSDTWSYQSGPPMQYELVSRGIGLGDFEAGEPFDLQVTDLAFDGGTSTVTLDEPRRHAWFRVLVPAETPSWEVSLEPTLGEAMMAMGEGALPNSEANHSYYQDVAGSRRQKDGREHYYRYPDYYSGTFIPSGFHYIGVGAEGQDAYSTSYIGQGPTTFTLTSHGAVDLQAAPEPLGAAPIRFDDQALRYGEQRVYRVEVPTGVESMEIRFESTNGYPHLTVQRAAIPTPTQSYVAAHGGDSYIASGDNVVSLADPLGVYYIVVAANNSPQGVPSSASYDLVIEAIGETPLAFNGGEATVTNQANETFRYFRVEVPASALGWDLRLHDVTGRPRLVIRRDERPVSLDSDPAYYPPIAGRGEWQSGWRWAPTGELTQRNHSPYDPDTGTGGLDESGRRVSMGMGTPLEPGTYLVGVSDAYPYSGGPMSYRIVSRGIGIGLDDQEPAQPWAIEVRDLVFGVEDSVGDLDPREHVYYRLQIPDDLESWSVELEPTLGEVMMAVRGGALPNADASLGYQSSSDDPYYRWGTRRQKNGREWFYKLPWSEGPFVASGTWYIGVGAEGQDPNGASTYIGTGKSGFKIRANGPVPIAGGPDQVVAGAPLVFAGERLAWGQQKYYRFRVPPTVAAFEVRLANRLGAPAFEASVEPYFEPRMPSASTQYYHASEGGSAVEGYDDVADQIVDKTGDVTVVVRGNGNEQVESGYDLVITPLETRPLAWDGGDETVTLKDQEAVYFEVEVPQDCDGVAQAGWIVSQEVSSGEVTVDVRKDYLPDSPHSPETLVTTARQTIIAPPYLSPGTWYVAVRATGNAEVRIRTSEVKELRHWVMPERGENASTPGLGHPFFGDTAVLADGSPGASGVDLGEGQYHFYRITVPANNRGVFRTRLDAISGDPELYIRRGAAATINQMPYPWGYNHRFVDYQDTLDGSTYGHWVVPDRRYGEALAPGEYWVAVYAQGSQVRYRLTLDVGQTTALPLNSDPLQGSLAAGDMRYFEVAMPQTAPTPGQGMPQSWTLSLNQRSGDALVLIREAVPPGLHDQVIAPASVSSYYLTDWNDDRSGYGYGYSTLPELDDTGTLTLQMPLLRPNTTYWIGVYARTDATFDIGSSVSSHFSVEATYPYRDATIAATVPANQLRVYRIDVPADAGRYWHRATVPSGIDLYLSVGYVPPLHASYADWSNHGYTEPYYNELDRGLEYPGGYVGNHPWVAGASYYLVAENTTGGDLAIEVELDGRDRLDDSDADGLADAWEYQYFGSLSSTTEDGDRDGDTLSNGVEEGLGTDPTDIDSDDDALADGLELIAGGDPTVQDTDLDQVCDGSDSAPDDPEEAGKVIRLYMHRYDDGSYGHNHGTNEHLTRLVAVFERFPEEGHWIHLRGWDIESADEVEVTLNGEHLGYLPVGGDGQYSIPVMYFIPSFQLFQSGDNRLELRQKTKGEAWGAIDLGLFSDGDTFGYDASQAYDQRHPDGFDIQVAQMPASLIELAAFDLESAEEVSVTVNGQPWLDRIMPTPNDKWTPFLQVPFVPADLGAGPYHLRVRRKAASDGNWQLRLMARRDLTSTFGNDGAVGEDGAHTQAFHFMYPNKPGQRELVLQYKATPNDVVEVEDTDGTVSIWAPTESWLWSPNQEFFSEGASHDIVTARRVSAEPPPQSPSFSVKVLYYGPCADIDGSGVLDCEEVCDDLDQDGAFAISELCGVGDDCDDDDPDVGSNVDDADCDGVPTAQDCDDNDPQNTATNNDDADCDGSPTGIDCDDNDPQVQTCDTCVDGDQDQHDARTVDCPAGDDCDDGDGQSTWRAIDADCDGVPSASDCNDNNANDTRTRAGDADCDGVPSASDCDDNDPGNTGTNAGDADCDGVATAADCNDNDAGNTRSKVGDADCDGVATADDCNDADASNTTARSSDADCDGVTTNDDCNDGDPAVTATRVGDLDCDKVASTIDCNDSDPTVVVTRVGDADCDGVATAIDCNDNSPTVTASKVGDADCDGVATAIDCNDNSAANKKTNVGDADCDGVATAVDCNDNNASVRNTNVGDADCDRVATNSDCNDRDPADTRTRVGDLDCDGVGTSTDCDDADPYVTATRVGDADCDGVGTSVDCSDNNAAITATRVGDADCDGVGTSVDCDDDNAAITATRVGDADCDRVATGVDCDDNDPRVTATQVGDADCDGVASGVDCDDGDRAVKTTTVGDADCDGVATDVDCDDGNAGEVRTNVGDLDCDGVPSGIDCHDTDATRKATRLNDADCDGVSTPIDCDDDDVGETRTKLNDADCDEVNADVDCDDHDPSVTATRAGDDDCDGVPTADDCDDRDPRVATTRAEDGDCDGIADGVDCAPADAAIATSTASDGDCDGVERAVDCDDDDGAVTRSRVGDDDCDGVPATLDCDDSDARATVSTMQDGDCDGVLGAIDCDDTDAAERGTCGECADGDGDGYLGAGEGCTRGDDCDDADAESTHRGVDGDCDGVVTREDCDDVNPALGAAVDDHDCDGVPAGVDCDDEDPGDATACEQRCVDADGDGHDARGPFCDTGSDCDDGDPASTTTAGDGDCDGLVSDDDCDDADPEVGSNALDGDCDGVPDANDLCPDAADPRQLDGDGDGTGDACDVCPALGDDQRDGDGDGVGDACEDRDGDGVGDAGDNCPDEANADQRDLDHDGLGDACDEPVTFDDDSGCGAGGLPALVAPLLLGLWALRRRHGKSGLLAGLFLVGCGDDPARRPIGATCEDASECALGLCSGGFCLDPESDDDYDGLVNGLEVDGLGTDPLLADTDGDGLADGDELVALANADGDGDGDPDALESASEDVDEDCIPDQYDAEDGVNNSDLTPLFDVLCPNEGVCGVDPGLMVVRCSAGDEPYCDYGAIPGFEDEEATCDGRDNDCDGATDENLPPGACAPVLVGVGIEPEGLTLWATQERELALVGRYADGSEASVAGDEVLWASDDEATASVVGGVVTGLGEGSARITATYGGFEASAEVLVVGVCAPGEEPTIEGCDGVTGELVGHYRLDGDGRDSSGYFAHGSVFGAAPVADRFGVERGAMAFCEAGDRVEVVESRHPLGDVSVTYTFWVKPTGEGGDEAVLSAGQRLPGRRSSVVLEGADDCVAYVGQGDAVADGMCVPPARWSFVSVVKDEQAVRFYVNAVLVGTEATGAGQDLRSRLLHLGLSGIEADGVAHDQLCGALDDVRIYARGLTAEEIARLYRFGGWQDVGTRDNPARDCDHILGSGASRGDDVYWLDPDGDGGEGSSAPPIQVYCDMTSDGGGWTLAWVYGFTDYAAFASVGNAVTPRPTWPAPGANVATSIAPPADVLTPGAIPWELWRHLGETMRVTSDLNDHLICRPDAAGAGGTDVSGGSLAAGTSGPVACEIAREVADACDGIVPVGLGWGPYGPSLAAEELYYYWDGSTAANWPTHDPCGRDRDNQVRGLTAPRGAVWLRHRP